MTSSRIQVANGRVIDPLDPDPNKISIEDIAHSLAHQCRFGGHTREFYSVAQHVVIASEQTDDREEAFNVLNHDDSEGYLVDMPSPLKSALFGDRYREVEDKLMTVIAEKFDFAWPMTPFTKYIDNAMLRTEVRDLLLPVDQEPEEDLWSPWFFADELPFRIKPWGPAYAEERFLERFYELGGKRG